MREQEARDKIRTAITRYWGYYPEGKELDDLFVAMTKELDELRHKHDQRPANSFPARLAAAAWKANRRARGD